MSEVLYRKWRPQTFTDVVGQEHIVRTLQNAVALGRVAHAYLFCGPRGTGKTSSGRILAKAINCLESVGGEPCNRCQTCRAYQEGRALDLVEMDAASNRGIEEMRRLRERVGLAPSEGRYKVYLVDEVHMLTNEANNALLKTLEEPPPHVVFILATTEPHKVPATIISRCQRFDFRRITLEAAVARLQYICYREGFVVEEGCLSLIARAAGGSLRDAVNLLEQMTAYYGPSLNTEQVRAALGLEDESRALLVVQHLMAADLAGGLRAIAAAKDDGVDMRRLGQQIVSQLRALLLLKTGAADSQNLDVTAERAAELAAIARGTSEAAIILALKEFGSADFRGDTQSSLPLELALAGCILRSEAVSLQAHVQPGTPTVAAAPASAPVTPATPPVTNGAARTADAVALDTSLPEDFLERLRQECKPVDFRVAALLNGSCEVESFLEEVLTLGFYRSFHKEKVEEEENRRMVEEMASRLLGRPVTLRCVLTEKKAGAPSQARGGHLLRAAREMGARPMNNPQRGGSNGPLST